MAKRKTTRSKAVDLATIPGATGDILQASFVYPTPEAQRLVDELVNAVAIHDLGAAHRARERLRLPDAIFEDWEATTGELSPNNITELQRQLTLAGMPMMDVLDGGWIAADVLPALKGALQARRKVTQPVVEPTPPANMLWTFQPGKAIYRGTAIEITDIPWLLLKALVEADGPRTRDELIAAGWEHDQGVTEDAVRRQLYRIRRLLKRKLGLDYDPIRNVARGRLAAWELNLALRGVEVPATQS